MRRRIEMESEPPSADSPMSIWVRVLGLSASANFAKCTWCAIFGTHMTSALIVKRPTIKEVRDGLRLHGVRRVIVGAVNREAEFPRPQLLALSSRGG